MLDPLGCHEPLPLVRRFHPLGFPLDLSTNSAEIIAAAEENWGAFPPAFDAEPMCVQIAISKDAGKDRAPSPIYRAMGHLMAIISDTSNFAVCDLVRGFAFCRLTERVAQDRAWMRQRFLDGIVYSMLVCREVTPIHAACVIKNGRGVLLCGPSGAGKSSLAFACARRGWTFLTDDVAYLRRGVPGACVVLGKPQFFKFLDSAKDLFPELQPLPLITDASGEPALELPASGIPTSFQSPVQAILFLNRIEDSAPHMKVVPPHLALERLMADIPSFGSGVYTLHRSSIDILVQTTKLAEFRYWELDSAVGALELFTGG